MDRRTFTRQVGLGIPAGLMAAQLGAAAAGEAAPAAGAGAPTRAADAAPFRIGMVVFDNMTFLDFAAPQDAFARVRAAKVHVLAKARSMVTTDTSIRIQPDMTLAEAPELDLLFIGGGGGTNPLMEDREMLDFLASRAPRAQWITSVCTGALVLGAAGLLRGYKAATHWSVMEALPLLGAEPVYERVVIDRNRITGGGVTAGLDFGLTVVARIFGDRLAQLIQLGQEYDPHPPFNAGSPRTAPPDIVQQYRTLAARTTEERFALSRRIGERWRAPGG